MSWWNRSRPAGGARRRFGVGCLPLMTLVCAGLLLTLAILLRPRTMPEPEVVAPVQQTMQSAQLRSVASFGSTADLNTRSIALFEEAGRVITHPRCMNCHPRTDRPTQTDAMRPHIPAVFRGPDDAGEPTLRCSNCHHSRNFDAAGVPGNAKWKLAPIEMAWQGKTLGEICRQILDPARSHMTRDQLLHHMAEDELVGWAWHPGGRRTPAPGTQAQFGALIRAWLETGGRCPA